MFQVHVAQGLYYTVCVQCMFRLYLNMSLKAIANINCYIAMPTFLPMLHVFLVGESLFRQF